MSLLIYEFLEKSAKEHPDMDAIRWLVKKDVNSITYGELAEDVKKIRRGLASEGYDHKHIAIIGSTCMEWVEAYLGVVTGTCTAVPLDAAMRKEELFELIRRSDASGVFLGKELSTWIPEVFEACPQVEKAWFIDGEPEDGADARAESLMMLKNAGAASEEDKFPAAADTAMIIFTSGTTGVSKGVMLSHENIADNVEPQVVSKGVGSVMLNVLPVHHAFCLVMDWLRGFANTSTVCINDSYMHIVRNMSIFKPVSTLMVPLMIETIYKRIKNADPSVPKEALYQKVFGGTLKRIYAGGAHLDPFYIEKFAEFGILVLEGYGMSECSPVISANMEDCYKPGSVGKPLKNVELRFENGEILVKGSSVMQKYYKMPEETAAALKDGWLHTGDKGYLDEDGFLFINGRLKNLIILANGENVSPEEIENKLALNDLVGEVIIDGEDHGLVAHIFPDPDVTAALGLDEEQVKNGLQKVLDEYNAGRPSYHQIVGLTVRKYPFIKSATKKIKRQEIHRDEPAAN